MKMMEIGPTHLSNGFHPPFRLAISFLMRHNQAITFVKLYMWLFQQHQEWQYVQWYFENFSIDLNLYSLSVKSEEKLRTIVDMMGMEQTPFLLPDSCENNTTS